ncbi:MAG: hypothetical protein PHI97_07335 [Desulfobulbus sp.]|nr:hypothetical protein [Desulfobulbus sp.]
MNQIQEMDWAEDCWHGHTGMDSANDYCIVDEKGKKKQGEEPEPEKKEPGDK